MSMTRPPEPAASVAAPAPAGGPARGTLPPAPAAPGGVPVSTATRSGALLVVPPASASIGRRLAWLLALALGAAGAGWGYWHYARPPSVALVLPWRGEAIEAVYATGVVEALDTARVGTTVAARIQVLLVDEGQTVRAGQVIAQLDDRQAQQRLADARARLALAEQELARDQGLAVQAIRSMQQVQRSQEARDSAAAAVQIAVRQLEEYRIVSPLDGVVMKRPVEPGETVAANAVLFEIASPAALRVAADVDERDIARVAPGARVAVRAEAFPGRAVAAKVTHIRGRGETATRSFRVEALLPEQTGLMIGMTVDVNVVVAERAAALLVPPTAVRHAPPQGGQPGAAHVFRIADGHARLVPVELGAVGPKAIEIRAGLEEGVAVIENPPAGIADGAAVTVIK